jgi:flavin-binding protein dodecin
VHAREFRGRLDRPSARRATHPEEALMSNHVYKHIELTGSSKTGTDDAIRNALAKASETIRNIQWFNVVETRGHVVDGKVAHWQVTINVGFTLE